MNNLDGIYNQALDLLSKGHSQEEVLVKFSQYRNELAPLLEISSLLLSVPKNIVPTPQIQRKYAVAKAKSLWLTWAHIPKLAGVTMSIMLLLSAFAVMGYQTLNSSPGQTLFAVKKSAEKLQLILALNQDQKASVQIQIAQKRLSEAQEIFNNPSSGADQKTAALTELTDQTNTAVAEVTTAAKNNPSSDKNHPLLNSLDSITHDQENLLAEIKPDSQIKVAANTALQSLNETTAKISEIKQSVAAADNSQTLAKLKADPNSVSVLGNVNKISKEKITVDDSVFTLIPQTIIQDQDGKTLSLDSLTEKTKVNVIGLKNQNNLVAQQIVVIASESAEPEVKDATTATASLSTLKQPSEESQGNSSSTSPALPDSNSAVGSVIFEAP
ncbi:MAG TPA: DUF5667 domain-containing protein [Candidatus Limnocylindria bacterium]|nr:DUF5667 domain-containing protein [Candidatus Limnocylindria bacterium]